MGALSLSVVYSASETAREEFPGEDVTVRGAVSIGRRLMDPLAELVKIDPKSIGVGQYQHDVDQGKLQHRKPPTAHLRERARTLAGAEHHRLPHGQRCVLFPCPAQEGAAPRAGRLHPMCGIPAHPGREESARCQRGSSREL